MHLDLDQNLVRKARELAKEITDDVQKFIDLRSTDSVERTVARFYGIDGVDADGIPLPNSVVYDVKAHDGLKRGIAYWIANACVAKSMSPQEVAESVGKKEFSLVEIRPQKESIVAEKIDELTEVSIKKLEETKNERDELLKEFGDPNQPYIYVIVATGNIYEDVIQAKAAVSEGADIIAVIRSTAQSLLDFVPFGPTTEGYGGTYATQANFRIMRKALDEVAAKVGRYVRLTNYASGLCMPEISAIAAIEGLDMLLNDSMYGILFRNINMMRTFVDQYTSRLICAFSHITINTGEDNYIKTSDPIDRAHTVTTSQLINEQFALKAGMEPKYMGIGHAFEIDPDVENGLLYEIAHALLTRSLFPQATPKYMPPTRYMTGNIFKGYAQNTLYNLVSVMTGQSIHLLGMLTEAIHTPLVQDRYLAISNAKYVFKNAKALGEDVEFKKDGFVQEEARKVLENAVSLLDHVKSVGLMASIEEGTFGDISRKIDEGKGADGVFIKGEDYYNPIIEKMEKIVRSGEL
jgi:beta-lysine 5,6-aminomutase alpha subunit